MFTPNLVFEKFALTGKLSLPHMLEDYLIKFYVSVVRIMLQLGIIIY